MSDIAAEMLETEIKGFLGSYPVTFIGHRFESWQEDKLPQYRQDLSDALVKCDSLMRRLRVVGRAYRDCAELQKKLLETRSGLEREFAKYEMYGLGKKGVPHPEFGIYSKPSRRPPERVPEHLREK